MACLYKVRCCHCEINEVTAAQVMLRKQLFVAIGMAAAVATLVVLWLHLADLHLPLPDGDDQVSRLAFAARWLVT